MTAEGAQLPSMYDSFAAATAGHLEFVRLSKATLTDLSHVLENLLLEDDLPGVVVTGFQASSNWTAELDRYERLAAPEGRTVAVFTADTLADHPQVLGFVLDDTSGLRQEWFVLVLTGRFCGALFGVDQPSGPEPVEEMDRLFDAAWTFDPELVAPLCELVVSAARRTDPQGADTLAAALDRYPPRRVDRAFEQRFLQRVFEVLEAGRRRWRAQLLREQAIAERLQQANRELVRLERLAAVGSTAAALAHELNNPLFAIGMAADLIQVTASEAEVPTPVRDRLLAHARLIAGQVERMGAMARGMLDLVRTGEPELRTLDLRPWLIEIGEELARATDHPVEIDASDDVEVITDVDRLRHVLAGLVGNASDADPHGHPIVLRLDVGATAVTVDVVDRGTGVAPAVREQLFAPFTTTKGGEGSGLGLPLARRFAEDLGGSVELRATGEDGSTFRVRLPRPGTDLDRGVPAGGVSEEPDPAAPPVPASPPARRAVLIDDAEGVRVTVAALLRRDGFEVDAVADADAAERLVEVGPIDVLLADLHFSDDVSLADLLARLERHQPDVRSRTVIITGDLARAVPELGVAHVLFKPFGLAELEAAVESVLR